MCAGLRHWTGLLLSVFAGLALLSKFAPGQDQDHSMLLRMQHSKANIDIDAANIQTVGRNAYDVGTNAPGTSVFKYPNNSSCLVVYNDGRYFLEKRDEQKLGKPKTKTAQGTLGPEDLQELKTILASEDIKKIENPRAPELPNDIEAIRDAETLDVQIYRPGLPQKFTTVKERIKTGKVGGDIHNLPSSGLDTFVDTGAPYKKSLSPLIKWFDGLEKKSKSSLKEAAPQYCEPMNIG